MSQFTNLNTPDNAIAISQIGPILAQTGITLPARTKREYFQHPGTPDIRSLAIEEVANGRDPLDSEQVRDALNRIKLDQVFHQHDEMAKVETRDQHDYYLAHYAEIETAFIDQFRSAVDVMREQITAHPKLSISGQAPNGELLVPYAHAVGANGKAEAAARGLEVIRRTLKPQQAKPGVYWYLKPTYAQVKAHNITAHNGIHLSLFDTLKAGITVDYTTSHTEAKDRADSIEAKRREERQRRAREQDEPGPIL